MITTGGFIALSGSMVATVYGYPAFCFIRICISILLTISWYLFFLPTALISAEMATGDGWQDGGVYKWVGTAFGPRWGFAAIFSSGFKLQ